jgi:hypothetical protein
LDAFPRQWLASSIAVCRRRRAGELEHAQLEAFVERAAKLLEPFATRGGRVDTPMRAHVLRAVA